MLLFKFAVNVHAELFGKKFDLFLIKQEYLKVYSLKAS